MTRRLWLAGVRIFTPSDLLTTEPQQRAHDTRRDDTRMKKPVAVTGYTGVTVPAGMSAGQAIQVRTPTGSPA